MNPFVSSARASQTEELLTDLYGDYSPNYSISRWIETGRREQERRNRLRRTARYALPSALLITGVLSLAQLWKRETLSFAARSALPAAPAAVSAAPSPTVRTLSDSELLDLASDYGRRTAMLVEIAGRKHLVVLDPSLHQ